MREVIDYVYFFSFYIDKKLEHHLLILTTNNYCSSLDFFDIILCIKKFYLVYINKIFIMINSFMLNIRIAIRNAYLCNSTIDKHILTIIHVTNLIQQRATSTNIFTINIKEISFFYFLHVQWFQNFFLFDWLVYSHQLLFYFNLIMPHPSSFI